jgi:hypothetical protein
MGLINADDASAAAAGGDAPGEEGSPKPTKAGKRCSGLSRMLDGMRKLSLQESRLVAPVSQEAQHAAAGGGTSSDVLREMFDETGVDDSGGRIELFVELASNRPSADAKLRPAQDCLWEGAVDGGDDIGPLAHCILEVGGGELEYIMRWLLAGRAGIRRLGRTWTPRVTVCDPPQAPLTISLNQFEALALHSKEWKQKVMVRGTDGQEGVAYFRLQHFLRAAAFPKENRGYFRKVDGRFQRSTRGKSRGQASPWIDWIDGGAAQPVGTREDRLLMAIDEQSVVERHLRQLDPQTHTGIGTVGRRLVAEGFRTADVLRDKVEQAVEILLAQSRYAGLELEHADIRQALCWYTPDLLLQACARPRLGWWLRMASDFLRAVWEPTVAAQLPLPTGSADEQAAQAVRNVAALWALEYRCNVQLQADEAPSWQSTDLYLLATGNALNRMMLEVLDPTLPMSPLTDPDSTETRVSPGKGFGLYARRELPLMVPPGHFVAECKRNAAEYAEEAPKRALEELTSLARLQLEQEAEQLMSATEPQLARLRLAHQDADALGGVAEAARQVLLGRQKRRRGPDDYTGVLKHIRAATTGIPASHALAGPLAAMVRTLRFCSSLQLLTGRSAERRAYQARFAVMYATREAKVALPLGFMRGVIQGKTAPAGGREPRQHLDRLAVAQMRASVDNITYDFVIPCINRFGCDIGGGTEPYSLTCTFEFTAAVSDESAELIYHEQLLRWAVIADRVAYPRLVVARTPPWTEQYRALVSSTDATAQAVWQFEGHLQHHGDPIAQIEQLPPRAALQLQQLQQPRRVQQPAPQLPVPIEHGGAQMQLDQQQELGQGDQLDLDDLF